MYTITWTDDFNRAHTTHTTKASTAYALQLALMARGIDSDVTFKDMQ